MLTDALGEVFNSLITQYDALYQVCVRCIGGMRPAAKTQHTSKDDKNYGYHGGIP